MRIRIDRSDSLAGFHNGGRRRRLASPCCQGFANPAAQLGDPSAGGRDGRHHRDAELLLQRGGIYGDAELLGFVHNVEIENQRQARFHQLQGQGQHAAQVFRVNDLHHDLRPLGHQQRSGDALFSGDG